MNALELIIASEGEIKGAFWNQGTALDRWHWAAPRPPADPTVARDRDEILKYSAGIGRERNERKNKHWDSGAGAELELPILSLPPTSSLLWEPFNPFSKAVSGSLFVRLIKQDVYWFSSFPITINLSQSKISPVLADNKLILRDFRSMCSWPALTLLHGPSWDPHWFHPVQVWPFLEESFTAR